MSEMRELIDTELDAVVGGHGCCCENQGNQFGFGDIGSFSFGNFSFGNIINFGNIVIQPTIALQIGVAVGGEASVIQGLSQLNFSSITSEFPRAGYGSMGSEFPRVGYGSMGSGLPLGGAGRS